MKEKITKELIVEHHRSDARAASVMIAFFGIGGLVEVRQE